jgi:WD40 repeat protein
VWDETSPQVIASCIAHDGLITGVAYSAALDQVFTCSNDGTTKGWRINEGREIVAVSVLSESALPVVGIACTTNGSTLFAAICPRRGQKLLGTRLRTKFLTTPLIGDGTSDETLSDLACRFATTKHAAVI